MKRILDLTERRRRLWLQPWERWERDFEAKVNRLTKLLEEEWVEERKRRASEVPGLRKRPRA